MGAEKDFSTLVGRMKVNAKPAIRRKAGALPTPRMGSSKTGDPRSLQKVGAKSENPLRRSGSGKGVL